MRFGHLQILWLLLVIPPGLLAFFWWSERKRRQLLTQFVQARLLSTLTVGLSPARQKIRLACLTLAIACVLIALARPQWHYDLEKVEQRGVDIVVAIDTSKSMLAGDVAPNRLERSKLAALDLMQQAKADRLGLVAFAGDAFLECPLTIDDTAFRQSVETLDVNTIPQGGTALAAAINTALTAFKERDRYKVLVLLTDGEDNVNANDALAAAQDAAKSGLKIFTVGVGTVAGDLLRVTDANGNSDYVHDPDGNVVKSHLNEALLQQMATTAGGFYLPLRPNTMDTLYEKGIAPLPKSEFQERLVRHYHEQFRWPLLAAILSLLAEMLLRERKQESRGYGRADLSTLRSSSATEDGPVGQDARPRVPTRVLLIVAFIFLPLAGSASPASALREYHAGNYTNALQEFSRLALMQTNDLRLVFNAGAAAYRATNFNEALKDFSLVTLSPDLQLQQQAFYNLGNAQFRIGELANDLDGMQNTWEMAVKSYERAHELDTNDVDAAFNLTFAKNCVAQIVELRAAARRAKEAADENVRRSHYHRALEIMDNLLRINPAAKPFQEYTKRLKDIDDIATPHQP